MFSMHVRDEVWRSDVGSGCEESRSFSFDWAKGAFTQHGIHTESAFQKLCATIRRHFCADTYFDCGKLRRIPRRKGARPAAVVPHPARPLLFITPPRAAMHVLCRLAPEYRASS